MMMRRARGTILRLIRRRALALALGATLVVSAVWLEHGGHDAWWVEGLGLVVGATGVALFWTGVVGLPPDWIDNSAGRNTGSRESPTPPA
jgi:hypothetical protein